jgi:lipopolysaccharide heptosyltransferase III
MGSDIKFSAEPRILIITMRRLGDVLLSTPLARALRQGIPGARVDMLVFRGTEGMLAGNLDIDRVFTISPQPGAAEFATLAGKLWRQYDIAISTQAGDRPTALAAIAGRFRVGLVDKTRASWKRLLLNRAVAADPGVHRVIELGRLASTLGIDDRPDIVVPRQIPPMAPRGAPYAVLHANPMYRIRRWTDEGWRALAEALAQRGLAVVATGGPAAEERDYLDRLWNPVRPPVERTDGRLAWGELAQLLSGAAVFVGPDTSMTHLAAGSGCPTVAIYGPASPHGMGPWPVGGLHDGWACAGNIQNRGNVWVVQNPLPCMPCDLLGCERHLESYSRCLDELPVGRVLEAVDLAMGRVAMTAQAGI